MSTKAPEIIRFFASQEDGEALLGGHPLVDRFEHRPAGEDLEYAVLLKSGMGEPPWPNNNRDPWPAREAELELNGELPAPDSFLAAIPNAEYVTYIAEYDPPADMRPFWSAKVWRKVAA